MVADQDEVDDDFEFDRESPAFTRSPLASPKARRTRSTMESRKKSSRTRGRKSMKAQARVKDLMYESGADRYAGVCFLTSCSCCRSH